MEKNKTVSLQRLRREYALIMTAYESLTEVNALDVLPSILGIQLVMQQRHDELFKIEKELLSSNKKKHGNT